MMCPKCQSENVVINESVYQKKKRGGLLYWIFIGWWLEAVMWIFLTIPWLIVKNIKPNKYKNKVIKKAVCQMEDIKGGGVQAPPRR